MMDNTVMDNVVDNLIEYADDFPGNMPCDNTGFCAGTSCPQFFKCQGGTNNA